MKESSLSKGQKEVILEYNRIISILYCQHLFAACEAIWKYLQELLNKPFKKITSFLGVCPKNPNQRNQHLHGKAHSSVIRLR